MTTDRPTLRITLAQLNAVVGDIQGNVDRVLSAREEAAKANADLIVFPELFITGYPPEDLVRKPAFQQAARKAVEDLAEMLKPGPAVCVGTIWPEGGKLYNAVAILDEGTVQAARFKAELPNYGVFDEKRVFDPGPLPGPVNVRGVRIGFPVCEDIWKEEVTECLAECGAEILVSSNGSPFDWSKPDVRTNIAVARITETGLPIAYLNLVGGQDELVFDGASFVLNKDCSLACQFPAWEEAIITTEWSKRDGTWHCATGHVAEIEEGEAAAYHACTLGLRDYVNKNGFDGVVIGLSGGIDSALVAAIAVDALGAERIHCVMLPYRYTSDESLEDAAGCANALGVRLDTIPIAEAVEGFGRALATVLKGTNADTTEENIQARTRGAILMAISNKTGALVLTTGNKSEMSVGYATLYGDMNGGFNPIKDLYKMQVYALARWRNSNRPKDGRGPAGLVIPERILTKAPTAELKANQTDQDSLPPYPILDDILECLVENEMSLADIIARGHTPDVVKKIERMLYLAEYKRRQAAPGVKISEKSFGRDRRYPITNKYRETLSTGEKESGESTQKKAPGLIQPRADGGEMG